jgi:tetratricopeptide (TPR) repeat protein
VRVTVQLVDVRSGTQLASSALERPMGELFELEDDLAHEVAAALRRRLGAEIRLREVAVATTSDRARELLLMANKAREDAEAIASNPDTLDTPAALALLGRSDSLLSEAADADSRWVRPIVARGWVAGDLANLETGAPSMAHLRRGIELAEQAIRRAPDDAAARELRGTLLWRLAARTPRAPDNTARLDGAESDLRRAAALDSTLASAWSTLSQLLSMRGAFAESDVDARRALAEDAYLTDAPTVLDQLYTSSLMLGDYKSAGKWCERGRRDYPAAWSFVECHLTLLREDPSIPPDPALAWSLVRVLDSIDPPAKAQSTGRAYSPIYRQMVAATISARAGDKDSARSVMTRARRAVASDSELSVELDYDEAYLRLVLGERSDAVRLLRAYLHANPAYRQFISRDRLLQALREALE